MDEPKNPDMAALRKFIHDLNNRTGVILGTAELLGLEQLSPRAEGRRKTIEDNAIEIRDILQSMSARYFSS
jgi:hypothetical protein